MALAHIYNQVEDIGVNNYIFDLTNYERKYNG